MEFKYQILFGIIITLSIIISISFTIYKKNSKKKSVQKSNMVEGENNIQQNGDGNTSLSIHNTITVNSKNTEPCDSILDKESNNEPTIEQIKNKLRVVFVDDKTFNIVNLLRKCGWKQISYKKDILDIDAPDVSEAHVFFLDINGVGVAMKFSNQGMGLCGAIKRKYGNKKRVVLYSGETDGNIFDSDAKMADDTLKKDSDLNQFTSLMEQYGKELL